MCVGVCARVVYGVCLCECVCLCASQCVAVCVRLSRIRYLRTIHGGVMLTTWAVCTSELNERFLRTDTLAHDTGSRACLRNASLFAVCRSRRCDRGSVLPAHALVENCSSGAFFVGIAHFFFYDRSDAHLTCNTQAHTRTLTDSRFTHSGFRFWALLRPYPSRTRHFCVARHFLSNTPSFWNFNSLDAGFWRISRKLRHTTAITIRSSAWSFRCSRSFRQALRFALLLLLVFVFPVVLIAAFSP